MLPFLADDAAQDITGARSDWHRPALPPAAGPAAKPHIAGREKRQRHHAFEHRLIAMPADARARRVFRDQRLCQIIRRDATKTARDVAQRREEFRHRFGRPQRLRSIIIAKAVRHDPALAEIAMKLKRPEWQRLEFAYECALLRR